MRQRKLALLLLLAWPASAYYHFVRYASALPPFTPVYEKFDLRALPGNTVQYFISSGAPLVLAPGDSEAALYSQIRAAAEAWSTVPTSQIRLAFGGFRAPDAEAAGPHIQVEFTDELPPGIIAQGGPVSWLDIAEGPDGAFAPIARSVIRLPRNLANRPSWTERFFLTVVHEFGHTLGLQHTWTSSVMSTEITRATTKARPLALDDHAALSVLYPADSFRKTTGSIQGRVMMNGQGVALASVVAFSPGKDAVSTLAAPDGTFRIDGLPPGPYFVYTHPLPPAIAGEPQPVNLELPSGPGGRIFPGAAFDLAFYGGSLPGFPVQVQAGSFASGVDFRVSPRASVSLHSVQTYSFIGRNAVKPAVIHVAGGTNTAVFTGYGASALTSGFSLSTLNAPETVVSGSLRPYISGYLMADFSVSPMSAEGPRHLLFRNNSEQYVLPSGLWIAAAAPPSIDSVTPDGTGRILLRGRGLSQSTSVWVDGVPCHVEAQPDGILATPPPAPAGHRGVLVAFNRDGQSSLFVHGDESPVFSYAGAEEPSIAVADVRIPAGAELAVEISGVRADFRKWPPLLGLGTSDVVVRRVWVTGESSAIAWLAARDNAAPAVSSMTASVGLASMPLPASVAVLPAFSAPFVRMSELQHQYLHPGAAIGLLVQGVPAPMSVGSVRASLGGMAVNVLNAADGRITIQIPPQLSPGAHLLRLSVGGVDVLPAAIEVRPVPPVLIFARKLDGSPVSSLSPARPGEYVVVGVASLAEVEPLLPSLRVFSGAVEHQVTAVRPNPDLPGTWLVEIRLANTEPENGTIPLTLTQGAARSLAPFSLPYLP
jgi:uncharacterized protein (TIGR03437 family)